MKSKALLLPSVFIIIIFWACNRNNRDEASKLYFTQKVSDESKDGFKVVSFQKTNGVERELNGQKVFDLEFSALIEANQEIWKEGNIIEGQWQNFSVLATKPRDQNIFLAREGKHWVRGQQIDLVGKIKLENTDNGWRPQSLVITTASMGKIDDSYLKDKRSNKVADNAIEPKKLLGKWKSLTTDDEIIIYEENSKFFMSGRYFPGIEKDGDVVTITQDHNGDKYSFIVMYTFSPNTGGGGSDIQFDYYPDKDHFAIGNVPYKTNDGMMHGSMSSSKGVIGPEFERMKD